MKKKEADEFVKNAKNVMRRIFEYGYNTYLNGSQEENGCAKDPEAPDYTANIEELTDYGWTEIQSKEKHFKCFTLECDGLSEEAAKRFKYINSRKYYEYREYDVYEDCVLDTHKNLIYTGYGDHPFYSDQPNVSDIYDMGKHLEEILDYYVKRKTNDLSTLYLVWCCSAEANSDTIHFLDWIKRSVRLREHAQETANLLYIITGDTGIAYHLAQNAYIPMYDSDKCRNEIPIQGLRFSTMDLLEYLHDKRHIFNILERWGDDIYIRRQVHDLVSDAALHISDLPRMEKARLEIRRSLYEALNDDRMYTLKVKYNQSTASILETGENIKQLVLNKYYYADEELRKTFPMIRFENLSFKNVVQVTDAESNILYKK